MSGQERLDDVLILLPSYKQPHPYTRAFIDLLVELGASISFSWGCSDPALHRCIIAGRAWRALREDVDERYQYVIWIDDDMVAPRGAVQLMRRICKQKQVSVSGLYCKRGNQRALCQSLWNAPPIEVELAHREIDQTSGISIGAGGIQISRVDLLPVIGGMGCLMVPRDQFLKHCQSVPNVHQTFPDGVSTDMPGICSSGFCADEDGGYGWLSEDLVYCQSLWRWASGVYAAPIAWGHVSEVQCVPTTDAVWLHKKDHSVEPAPETKASSQLT